MSTLTVDELKSAFPEKTRRQLNKQALANIAQTLSEPEMFETYRDNLLNYAYIMKEGKFKVVQYVNAVKYVSWRLAGHGQKEAYAKTFPGKMQQWAVDGIAPKDQSSYISAYNKSKLVTMLYEQTMTPVWILNQDAVQQAINTQVEIMQTSNSDMARVQAANSILTHVKAPETTKIEVGMSEESRSIMDELRDATEKLAATQRQGLQAGTLNAKDVAESPLIINGEAERVE